MPTSTIKAAQYVRMSTERQEYSPTFQKTTNEAFAMAQGMRIVRTYEDAGVSGLSLRNREGLKALLADVLSGAGGFTHVLVYDVSRWGRFQNSDQAAYYEFMCAQAGVSVFYCAESFTNDGSPTSQLLKHIKRTMAAEYSRELSEKVSRAQRGLLAQGFWTGGRAPLGLRRVFARDDGTTIAPPSGTFVRKQQGVRTKLILGPEAEVEFVRKIFAFYLYPNATTVSVARKLTADPQLKAAWGDWSARRVRYVLDNEAYIGKLIGGRHLRPVGIKSGGDLPREDWIIVEGGIPPIVAKDVFEAAQRKRRRNRTATAPKAALADLKRIGTEHGYISQGLIRSFGRWSPGVYYRQLGSMSLIRDMLGLTLPAKFANYHLFRADLNRFGRGSPKYSMEELDRHLRTVLGEHGSLSREILDAYGTPSTYTIYRRYGSMAAAYRAAGYQPSASQLRKMPEFGDRREPGGSSR
ncbi:hypothetical protein D3C71_271310 [compost metagenome]